jgi:glycosyltransferase involved in cell wall biosynthesis
LAGVRTQSERQVNVLVVTPSLPYPGIPHAGGLYVLKHLEQLVAHGAKVTVLAVDDAVTPEIRARVPDWFESVVVDPSEPLGRSRHWGRDRLRARLRHASLGPGAIGALRESGLVERAHEADLVELHWPELSPLVTLLRSKGVTTPISLVEHDVGAQAATRRVKAFGSRRARLAQGLARPILERFERADLDAADLVLVFKEADVGLIRRLGSHSEVQVIDPYLEPPRVSETAARRPGSVLFTGALWRPDTNEALLRFVREVWPAVHRLRPEAVLTLAGAGPSSELCALAETTGGVELTGEVPSLEPYYRLASVFVAPLLVGGGLKFKVPQAMLHGLPVVATTVAAEGVHDVAPPGTFWAVTDDPATMAAAIVAALEEPDRAAATGARAARWCARHFSFESSLKAVVARYRALIERGEGR